jgi:AraC-like DNA-binding protein
MPDVVLADPDRIALWLQAKALSESGIGTVHRWGPADGLPTGAPGPAHQHAVPTLVICLAGVVRVRGRQVLDLQRGEALIVEPGCWHEHVPHKRGSTSFGLGFLAGRCDVLFIDHRETLWGMVPEAPYREWCELLVHEPRDQARRELVEQCLAQALRDQAKVVDWIDPEALRMAAHLWNHLHRPINGAEVIAAARLGRSKAHVLFKAFFGRGPKQELMESRLAIARHLLLRGFSVTAAAQRCGFRDRADLSRAYRRRFGHPPTAAAELRPQRP